MNRDLCMHIGRRAYVHQIDFQAGGEHFLMVVKNRTVQPVFLFHFLRLFRIDVAERCDPASVRKGQKPFHMGMGDIAASYYRCLYHLYLHSEASSFLYFPAVRLTACISALTHSSAALKACSCVMAFSVRMMQSRMSCPKKG